VSYLPFMVANFAIWQTRLLIVGKNR